jgi:triacylglycerol lipase
MSLPVMRTNSQAAKFLRSLIPAVLLGWVNVAQADCVVLLHGLARSELSMSSMADALVEADYRVANIGYSSRLQQIEQLAGPAVEQGFVDCQLSSDEQIHFVTHSLGGILLRYYLSHAEQTKVHDRLGNVVMLGPPNQGSEVVDALKELPGYSWLNGPAGYQLGTDLESVPLGLPAVDFSLGVIAGNHSIDPVGSYFLPDPDDGKVSVASTRVEGMNEHMVLPVTHTFMMSDYEVQRQVIHYLRNGSFDQSHQ